MELDKWFGLYKVRVFPWIDGKRIYVNVQFYEAGKSMERPPIWDKTVYITNDEAGQRLVFDFTHTLIQYVETMQITDNTEVTITVEHAPTKF